MTRSELAYEDYLQLLPQAATEENTLAVVNGGVEAALVAIEHHATLEDREIRAELIEIELSYIRGTLDAYTQFRIGKTFRAELEAMTSG